MLRIARPTTPVTCLGVSVALALGSASAHSQTSPQQPRVSPPVDRATVARVAPITSGVNRADAVIQPWSLEAGTAPIAGAPYTATTVTSFMHDGRIVRLPSTRFFRDSQGRTRVESGGFLESTPAGSPSSHTLITINDPVSGERYVLHQQGKYAQVFVWWGIDSVMHTPVEPPSLANAAFKSVALGEKLIGDIKVVGTRMERTERAVGNQKPVTVTLENWFSPELGVMVLTTRRSTIGGESSYQLEQILRAEPDPALFRVPPDYARSPVIIPSRSKVMKAAAPGTGSNKP
jgi:hypothetical protein